MCLVFVLVVGVLCVWRIEFSFPPSAVELSSHKEVPSSYGKEQVYTKKQQQNKLLQTMTLNMCVCACVLLC